MKKKKPIGFKPQFNSPDDPEDENGNSDPLQPIFGPPACLSDVITALFYPASTAPLADEMISPVDLWDTISQSCDVKKSDLFTKMKELGFLTETVENQLYWLVCYVK